MGTNYRKKVTFLILHYKAIEDTRKCIDSILNLKKDGYECKIVVVDNASPDDSGRTLQIEYDIYENIEIIILQENIGFSKGNNFGYNYIDKDCIDFLVVANNDIIFDKVDFLEQLNTSYERNKWNIVGPDVRLFDDIFTNKIIHGSPLSKKILTKEVVNEKILQNEKILKYLQSNSVNKKMIIKEIVKNSFLYKPLHLINIYKQQHKRLYNKLQENVCLSGACLIFDKRYVNRFVKIFEPETFFYSEEALLQLKSYNLGLSLIYDPSISVFHAEKSSTKSMLSAKGKADASYMIFRTKNMINSLKIYKEVLEKGVIYEEKSSQ